MHKKRRVYVELSALKGRIRELKSSYRRLSGETGISIDALNNKINGYSIFNAEEMDKVSDVLDIPIHEVTKYFFPHRLRNATKSA